MKLIVSTFHPLTGDQIEVELISMSATGLRKVKHNGKVFARHRYLVTTQSEAARTC